MSLNAIARRFNEDEVLTARGQTGGWTATATTVRMILERINGHFHPGNHVQNLDNKPMNGVDSH